MHAAGDDFLAGPGFTQHQHRGIGGGHLANMFKQGLHGRAVAQYPAEAVIVGPLPDALLLRCLARGGVVGNDTLHCGNHVAVIEGLGDVVHSPHAHGVDRGAQAGITGHDEHGHLTRLADQVGTRGAGQAQIADNQVEVFQFIGGDRFLHGTGFNDLVVVALQQPAQGGADDGLVFDNEDSVHQVLPRVYMLHNILFRLPGFQ